MICEKTYHGTKLQTAIANLHHCTQVRGALLQLCISRLEGHFLQREIAYIHYLPAAAKLANRTTASSIVINFILPSKMTV